MPSSSYDFIIVCISWNNKKCFDIVDARCKHEDLQPLFETFCGIDWYLNIFDSRCFSTLHSNIFVRLALKQFIYTANGRQDQ
jgi:hypothetical protein